MKNEKEILKIKVKYRGKWYYASSISINKKGEIVIEYCHGLLGCVDSEHIEDIIIIKKQEEDLK